MPGCGGTSCSCSVKVGDGLTITGSGALDNPFVIELAGGIEDALVVVDSTTIDFTLAGGGSPTDPYRLSANAKMKVSDLADVVDPEGSPSSGDTLVWVTAGVPVPRFEFRPPPPNPAGSVNTGVGLTGTGAAGSPLAVKLIGTSAGGVTTGLEVYADSAGNLRAVTPVASAVAWDAITGKPSVFAANDGSFSGTLSVGKGGTGSNSLATITVGNSTKVDGHRHYVQSAQPSGGTIDDLWFW